MNKLEHVFASLPYEPSSYQKAIAEWVINGRGNAMVDAKAGSGKTSTLVDIVAPLVDKAQFCAFNKHIAAELGQKLRGTGVSARTLHSSGFATLRYHHKGLRLDDVEGGKYRRICKDLLDECYNHNRLVGRVLSPEEQAGLEKDVATSIRALVGRFVELVRVTLAGYDTRSKGFTLPVLADFENIANHFGLAVEPQQWALLVSVVNTALSRGLAPFEKGSKQKQTIDYTDMVWLPSVLGLRPYQFSWVLVNECQDLNAAQLELAMNLTWKYGRMLFVGDPNQAIYGFAGADCDSFWNIQRRTNAKVLPLSICYRCPTEHIALAQEIVPEIEAAPNAIEGGVFNGHDLAEMVELLVPEDVVLCRNTAPLVTACYEALKAGKPAYVAGRAIGEGIAKAVEEACGLFVKAKKRQAKIADIDEALELWEARERKSLARRDLDEDSQQWQDLSDRVECILTFWSRSEATTVAEYLDEILALFDEDKENATRLSTVHRAKGLEADRVFILKPELMPSPYARMEWEQQQEYNLLYVALTRAKSALHFVDAY